jgi:hypothetical protein
VVKGAVDGTAVLSRHSRSLPPPLLPLGHNSTARGCERRPHPRSTLTRWAGARRLRQPRPGRGQARRTGHARFGSILVDVGPPQRRKGTSADDREEPSGGSARYMAGSSATPSSSRMTSATAWRRRSLSSTTTSRKSAPCSATRGSTRHRSTPDQAAAAQARGVVLRGEGCSDAKAVRTSTRSGFQEHCCVPRTRRQDIDKISLVAPTGFEPVFQP